ncbi:VIT1/CCC1 transporter family protein [Nocardia sp. NBC_01388]|uniref:VIT1/CCC1 transporter family protein n=1 Tax=Nocardia sp. NBC_01388 TaxID=2903596 RepID=UPI003247E453
MNRTLSFDGMNRLRAAVLGANDGIVSVAALIIGVAAADTSRSALLTTGLAALLAGAVSMGLGEYVSVATQRDAERPLVQTGEMRADQLVRPWSAASASAVAFTAGALLPLVAILTVPVAQRIPVTVAAVLVALTITGIASAHLGATPWLRPTARILSGGAAAMAITYLVGYLAA